VISVLIVVSQNSKVCNLLYIEQMRQQQDQMKSQQNAQYEQQLKDNERSSLTLRHVEG